MEEENKMNVGLALVVIAAIKAITTTDEGEERALPFKLRYKLTTIKDAFQKEADLYEKERVALIEKYGDEVTLEDGQTAKEVRDPEKLEEFYKHIEEALLTEIDTNYKKLTMEDIKPIEDIEINITDLQLKTFFMYIVEQEK